MNLKLTWTKEVFDTNLDWMCFPQERITFDVSDFFWAHAGCWHSATVPTSLTSKYSSKHWFVLDGKLNWRNCSSIGSFSTPRIKKRHRFCFWLVRVVVFWLSYVISAKIHFRFYRKLFRKIDRFLSWILLLKSLAIFVYLSVFIKSLKRLIVSPWVE